MLDDDGPSPFAFESDVEEPSPSNESQLSFASANRPDDGSTVSWYADEADGNVSDSSSPTPFSRGIIRRSLYYHVGGDSSARRAVQDCILLAKLDSRSKKNCKKREFTKVKELMRARGWMLTVDHEAGWKRWIKADYVHRCKRIHREARAANQ